jgi:hypothetical protein
MRFFIWPIFAKSFSCLKTKAFPLYFSNTTGGYQFFSTISERAYYVSILEKDCLDCSKIGREE